MCAAWLVIAYEAGLSIEPDRRPIPQTFQHTHAHSVRTLLGVRMHRNQAQQSTHAGARDHFSTFARGWRNRRVCAALLSLPSRRTRTCTCGAAVVAHRIAQRVPYTLPANHLTLSHVLRAHATVYQKRIALDLPVESSPSTAGDREREMNTRHNAKYTHTHTEAGAGWEMRSKICFPNSKAGAVRDTTQHRPGTDLH